MALNLELKQATQQELAFVFSSFLKTLRSWDPFRLIPDREYFAALHTFLEHAIRDFGCTIAKFPGEDVILGWIVGDDDQVVFCNVKQAYRRIGIATALVTNCCAKEARCSFLNHQFESLLTRAGIEASLDPYSWDKWLPRKKSRS